MKKNMSSADRIIRLALAIAVIALYFTGNLSGTLGVVLLIAAIIIGLTAFVNFCPIYSVLGIRTNRSKSS